MINGGVSLTLINYNQIKDFISLNLSSVFGHTVNQRRVIFALRDFSLFSFPFFSQAPKFTFCASVFSVEPFLESEILKKSPGKMCLYVVVH